ncbi:MAG: iron-sulfur cluster co-chaperone HscB C-terminal domain-containing protein [Planctomycetota bacterium]
MDQPHPTPFAMLGLTPTFNLTPAAIERAYLTKAAAAHPDLQTNNAAPEHADPESQSHAADLNLARQTLISAERRANALLDHLGGPSSSDHTDLPQGFLRDIMHTRLELEEAVQSKDADAIDRFRDWAKQQRASYTSAVNEAFESLAEPAEPNQLADIRTTLNAWRYIERLIEQLPPRSTPTS